MTIYPLNTKRVYARSVTRGGCEVFYPVDSFDPKVIADKMNEVNAYLDTQPEPEKKPA